MALEGHRRRLSDVESITRQIFAGIKSHQVRHREARQLTARVALSHCVSISSFRLVGAIHRFASSSQS
ncbi:hypothetical protein PUN28_014985 [Cardiocondyla obscurior]|uniref:Transposase n=1 Tax=Cardiocondyla obscurior TaxID=286306 RepID=A0AAW2F0S8_9HYME